MSGSKITVPPLFTWVGRKTGQKLEAMGIKTIGDLAQFDPAVLIEAFGASGTQLYLMAQGIDRSEVQERGEVKSISREVTFEEDTADPEFVLKTLQMLSEEVHRDALEQRFYFKTVTVRVRYENFETHIHSKTLPFITGRLQDLSKTASRLMQSYFRPDRKLRLVGVRVSNLVSGDKQKTLV
jgi:DNA polymerase IV (DinB-like DNA polymerase)